MQGFFLPGTSMRTILTFCSEFAEVIYIILAGAMGFMSAYLRSIIQAPDKSRVIRLSEAGLCAMFSSSLAEIASTYLDIALELALPIGVFAGYLGAPVIVDVALQILRRKAHIDTGEGK